MLLKLQAGRIYRSTTGALFRITSVNQPMVKMVMVEPYRTWSAGFTWQEYESDIISWIQKEVFPKQILLREDALTYEDTTFSLDKATAHCYIGSWDTGSPATANSKPLDW